MSLAPQAAGQTKREGEFVSTMQPCDDEAWGFEMKNGGPMSRRIGPSLGTGSQGMHAILFYIHAQNAQVFLIAFTLFHSLSGLVMYIGFPSDKTPVRPLAMKRGSSGD